MNSDHDPLTAEERELADALARTLSRRGPSPQVDAAILANARAALARGEAPRARRRRPRWPAAFGVAASLALAVGVAWQLRPGPDADLPVVADGPASMAAATADTEGQRAQPKAAATPAPSTAPLARADAGAAMEYEPAPSGQDAASRDPVSSAEPETQASAPPLPAPPPAVPAPLVAEAPAGTPQLSTADAGPAIDAHPAETAIGRRRVRQDDGARAAAARTLGESARVATPGLRPQPAHTAGDANAGVVFDQQELHEDPPATVDSPGIHRAWLDRIRELRDAGELEAARESLREFRRRYPAHVLPDDLDELLDE